MNAPLTSQELPLQRFTALRLEAERLLTEASRLPGLPAHYTAQAVAASRLCGTRLARIPLEPTGADALAVRGDIEHIAKRIVDPLIEAIGEHASENFPSVDLDHFKEQLFSALDGNATFALEQAAENAGEETGAHSGRSEHSTLNNAMQGGW